jgi:hypothetical protein
MSRFGLKVTSKRGYAGLWGTVRCRCALGEQCFVLFLCPFSPPKERKERGSARTPRGLLWLGGPPTRELIRGPSHVCRSSCCPRLRFGGTSLPSHPPPVLVGLSPLGALTTVLNVVAKANGKQACKAQNRTTGGEHRCLEWAPQSSEPCCRGSSPAPCSLLPPSSAICLLFPGRGLVGGGNLFNVSGLRTTRRQAQAGGVAGACTTALLLAGGAIHVSEAAAIRSAAQHRSPFSLGSLLSLFRNRLAPSHRHTGLTAGAGDYMTVSLLRHPLDYISMLPLFRNSHLALPELPQPPSYSRLARLCFIVARALGTHGCYRSPSLPTSCQPYLSVTSW